MTARIHQSPIHEAFAKFRRRGIKSPSAPRMDPASSSLKSPVSRERGRPPGRRRRWHHPDQKTPARSRPPPPASATICGAAKIRRPPVRGSPVVSRSGHRPPLAFRGANPHDPLPTSSVQYRRVTVESTNSSPSMPEHPRPGTRLLALHLAELGLPDLLLADRSATPAAAATGMAAPADPRFMTALLVHRMGATSGGRHQGEVRRADRTPRRHLAVRAPGGIVPFPDAAEQLEVAAVRTGIHVNRHGFEGWS